MSFRRAGLAPHMWSLTSISSLMHLNLCSIHRVCRSGVSSPGDCAAPPLLCMARLMLPQLRSPYNLLL